MKIETLGAKGRSKFLPPRELSFASKTSHLDLLREYCVERLPDFGFQSRQGERLLEQADALIQHPVVANYVLGVARHVEHSSFWPKRGNALRQFAPVHDRHDDVGQQQVNRPGIRIGDPDGSSAVSGL